MSACVYVLRDPRTGRVRYVGSTGDLHMRLQAHVRAARGAYDPSPKDLWIRKCGSPRIEAIETVCAKALPAREVFWIRHYARRGAQLFNVTHKPNAKRRRAVNRGPDARVVVSVSLTADEAARLDAWRKALPVPAGRSPAIVALMLGGLAVEKETKR